MPKKDQKKHLGDEHWHLASSWHSHPGGEGPHCHDDHPNWLAPKQYDPPGYEDGPQESDDPGIDRRDLFPSNIEVEQGESPQQDAAKE
jgi:hypothetical protein